MYAFANAIFDYSHLPPNPYTLVRRKSYGLGESMAHEGDVMYGNFVQILVHNL